MRRSRPRNPAPVGAGAAEAKRAAEPGSAPAREGAGPPLRGAASKGLAAVLAAALASSCGPSASVEGYAEYAGQAEQEIERVGLGTGDVFEVRVYGEEELSGVYRVAPDGTIDFPLIGEISVSSRKPGGVARLLKKRLQEGYLRDPYVSVYVKEYNSHQVLVLGEVQKPGSFPYRGGMNVVEAIARAGGFKDTANGDHVVVTRTVDEAEERIPVPVSKISRGKAENLQLRAGDIVYVPASLL